MNGTERWFLVTVPGAHDGTTPLPLVIDFHGLREGAEIHTLMSAFSPVAEREGFVVAFPQGQFDPVRWNASPTTTVHRRPQRRPDVQSTTSSTRSARDLCLDRTRVYAAGLSYGGFMTSLLACGRSDRFAAVAPVAGLRLLDPCPQERPVPIITFHGTDDADREVQRRLRRDSGLSSSPRRAGRRPERPRHPGERRRHGRTERL